MRLCVGDLYECVWTGPFALYRLARIDGLNVIIECVWTDDYRFPDLERGGLYFYGPEDLRLPRDPLFVLAVMSDSVSPGTVA